MDRKAISAILLVVGIVLLLFSSLGRPSWIGVVFGLMILMGAVWIFSKNSLPIDPIQASSQPVPNALAPGFVATHRHQNIAIDAVSKNLWLRDESGLTSILTSSQVREWSVDWKHQSWGGGEKYTNCKLLIKTSSLDHPVHRIDFNAHTVMSLQTENNVKEAKEWSARLSAFYNQS